MAVKRMQMGMNGRGSVNLEAPHFQDIVQRDFSNRSILQVVHLHLGDFEWMAPMGLEAYPVVVWLSIHHVLHKWACHLMAQARQREVERCAPPWKQTLRILTTGMVKIQALQWCHKLWSRMDLNQLTKKQLYCMACLGPHQILPLDICTMRVSQLDMGQLCIPCTMFTLGLHGWQPLLLTFQIKGRFLIIPQFISIMLLLDICCTHTITNNHTIIATIGTILIIMSITIMPLISNHHLSHNSKESSQQLDLPTVVAQLPLF
jgi:hypothetical protein